MLIKTLIIQSSPRPKARLPPNSITDGCSPSPPQHRRRQLFIILYAAVLELRGKWQKQNSDLLEQRRGVGGPHDCVGKGSWCGQPAFRDVGIWFFPLSFSLFFFILTITSPSPGSASFCHWPCSALLQPSFLHVARGKETAKAPPDMRDPSSGAQRALSLSH